MWGNETPVEDGDVSLAHIGYSHQNDDFGYVEHGVDHVNHSVTNTTEPDHLLHPGVVVRTVYHQGSGILVRTEGYGTGAFPGTNVSAADLVWYVTDLELIHNQSKKVLGENLCAP